MLPDTAFQLNSVHICKYINKTQSLSYHKKNKNLTMLCKREYGSSASVSPGEFIKKYLWEWAALVDLDLCCTLSWLRSFNKCCCPCPYPRTEVEFAWSVGHASGFSMLPRLVLMRRQDENCCCNLMSLSGKADTNIWQARSHLKPVSLATSLYKGWE
jgi:hypothetical protein